ncbi:MAG: hypothetical protein KJ006_08570 [Thermoleophilia bacterium]|nr:hypothetical protein [Thermoleophilia bacterium]GIK78072.1 MAG: hypothetical protein BroJett022_17620 [Actinomycetes bacterium]
MNRGSGIGRRVSGAGASSRPPLLAAASLLAAAIAISMLTAGPASGGAPPGPRILVEGTSAFLDTFQALSSFDELSNDKSGDDFVTFSEALSPETLAGVEGTADAYVSQASTVVTPSFAPPFETEGLATSGRFLIEVHKNVNGAAGVPVAFADGEFDAWFMSTTPVPIELAGSLRAANTDSDECAEITVVFDDGTERRFEVGGGGECPPGVREHRSFQVNETLPAGVEAEIEVDGGATVSAEDPGSTESADGAVDVTLTFYPPNTRITSARIRAGSGKVSFKFKASGNVERLQCALTRKGKKPRFRTCRSPKRYRDLRPGRYAFQARAVGPVAPEATPARKSFRIK